LEKREIRIFPHRQNVSSVHPSFERRYSQGGWGEKKKKKKKKKKKLLSLRRGTHKAEGKKIIINGEERHSRFGFFRARLGGPPNRN